MNGFLMNSEDRCHDIFFPISAKKFIDDLLSNLLGLALLASTGILSALEKRSFSCLFVCRIQADCDSLTEAQFQGQHRISYPPPNEKITAIFKHLIRKANLDDILMVLLDFICGWCIPKVVTAKPKRVLELKPGCKK
jgi:hypothetical protein